MIVEARKHHAYINTKIKEYDIAEGLSLVHLKSEATKRNDHWERDRNIRDICEYLPQRYRGTYVYRGLIRFKDVLLVDDKGDSQFPFPHIFLDFSLGFRAEGRFGPFGGHLETIELEDKTSIALRDGYKRVKRFPDVFPTAPKPIPTSDRKLLLDPQKQWALNSGGVFIFDLDDRHGPLANRDIIEVGNPKTTTQRDTLWVEVIEASELSPKECIEFFAPLSMAQLEAEVGRKLKVKDKVRATELKRLYYVEPPDRSDNSADPL